MRVGILLFMFVVLISNVSAIRINEVEMNPIGGSSGNEWIELYNDKNIEIDVSGWEVWEGVYGEQGPKLILSIPEGTIIQKGSFYIVEWSKAKLNNAGDFVILYDSNGTKIDETPLLKDKENNDMTWQLCDSWEFKLSTKGGKNSCEEVPEEPTEEKEANDELPEIEEYQGIEEPVSKETTPIELQTINLNPKVIKSEDDNENLSKSNYAIYGLVFFCVLLVVLFILRKNKYNKNEFR